MTEREQEIQFYFDSKGRCPVCYTECDIDTSGSCERDSSGDVHRCPKCGWSADAMCLWGYQTNG
jgi:hypothetical protein